MRKLLLEAFGDLKMEYPDFQVIGKEAVFSLDKERYAKLSFTIYAGAGTPVSEHFDGCKIDIMNRTGGKLDTHMIAFSDVFDSALDLSHPSKISKHIWYNKGYEWYGKPTVKDLLDLRDSVNGYLNLLRVREEPERMTVPEEKYAAFLSNALELLEEQYEGKEDFLSWVQNEIGMSEDDLEAIGYFEEIIAPEKNSLEAQIQGAVNHKQPEKTVGGKAMEKETVRD